jgi:hypothetical protein
LDIKGDTSGWTVESTTPSGFSVNPQAGTVLGPSDSISTLRNYLDGQFSVTLSPPSNVSDGEAYNFTVVENYNGSNIDSDTFTISVVSSSSGEEEDSGSDENDSGDASNKQVAPGSEVTVTVTPDNTDNNLQITGDTDGWTVVSTNPGGPGTFAVNPSAGTVLEADGSISTLANYDSNGQLSVTLSPPSGASVGDSFQFNVQEEGVDNTDSFTISITSSVPSWVTDSSITAAQYNAFDDGDGELTDSEIRAGIDTYIENSFAGDNQINDVAFSNSDIRALISGYVSSQF